jgi:hypothetical protein
MDLKTYFAESYKTDFDTINKQVESDLNSLIKSEISKEKYSDVFVLGRKGISLFQPYIKKVNGENHLQGIYSIQLYSHSPHALIKLLHPHRFSKFLPRKLIEIFRKRRSGNVILLTDAIKTGTEVVTIIDETIRPNSVKKVCGYLARRDGLLFLQKKYPKIQFSFPKIVDAENYDNEQDRLQHIYQSRLIPSDGDHPYRIYSLKYQIGITDILLIIDKIILKYKSPDYPEIKTDTLIVPHISSNTFYLDLDLFLRENTNLQQELYTIVRAKIRIKFDPKTSQLRIMALALDDVEADPESEVTLIKYRQCNLDLKSKLCDVLVGPDMEETFPQKFCPHCLDVNISNTILDYVERELIKELVSNGIKIEKTEL